MVADFWETNSHEEIWGKTTSSSLSTLQKYLNTLIEYEN